jgi:hypothetical protein
MNMLRVLLIQFPAFFVLLALVSNVHAQDNNALLKEAKNLELKFDEPGALEKYKQIAAADPSRHICVS